MTAANPPADPADAATPAADGEGIWRIDRIAPRRSIILCAIGAVLGLAIAGAGLFTAEGTRTSAVPAEDAALVNGVPVLRSDIIAQVKALHSVSLAQSTPAQRRKVLDDMIREELYVQRGLELGLANDDIDVRSALVSSTEAQVAADAMTAQPTEAELRRWYDGHRASYANEGMMELHEYVVPPASAAAAVARLRGGARAADLGLKSSGRVDDGVEFYFAARIHLGDRLFAAARALGNGQVSDPVVEKDGAHILVMVRNDQPVPYPFDQARAQVQIDFLRDKTDRLQAENEKFLRRRADVRIASDLR